MSFITSLNLKIKKEKEDTPKKDYTHNPVAKEYHATSFL